MSNALDMELYSRTIYALGKDALEKLSKACVLLVGCDNLGIELAKNTILSGVSMYLFDNTIVDKFDVDTNLYINELMIGQEKASAVKESLAELNGYAKIEEVNESDLAQLDFTVVVTANQLINIEAKFNKLARAKGVPFIGIQSKGVFGRLFNDFGNEFHVIDTDGEAQKTGIIESFDTEGNVSTFEPHDLHGNDHVKFIETDKEVEKTHTINVTGLKTFKLNGFDQHQIPTKGKFVQIKMPGKVYHEPIYNIFPEKDFEYILTDFLHLDRAPKINQMFNWLGEVKKSSNTLDEAFETYKRIMSDNFEEELVKKFLQSINFNCVAVDSIMGGFGAQEIIKACTSKLMPVSNVMTYSATNAITEIYDGDRSIVKKLTAEEFYGKEMYHVLTNAKGFIVGSGAIGCEHLKNLAMLGIGNLVVTDMDTIEKSNLSRQFLFRSKHIGKEKSITASEVIKSLVPTVKIEAHNNAVGPKTRNTYDSKFFDSLTFVANALDNIDARKFMDSECVLHKKYLIESGTLGTKGNVQAIIPGVTLSYSSTRDPEEKSIPLCTLKNFPYKIDHTIAWARDKFNLYFEKIPTSAKTFNENPSFIKTLPQNEQVEFAKNIKWFFDNAPKNAFDCVKFGVNLWAKDFRDFTLNLLNQYPADATSNSGELFWSGTKRCPSVPSFNLSDKYTFNFVFSCAKLWAHIFGIDNKDITKEFVLSSGITLNEYLETDEIIAENEEEEKELIKKKLEQDNLQNVEDILPAYKDVLHYKITSHVFEKDDPTNYHIDFVTSCSNNRAIIYKIDPVDNHVTKGIAGKIIPALATTTSLVSGLATIEIMKICNGCDKLEDYNDTFINLAMPEMIHSEPREARPNKRKGFMFTLWDNFVLTGNPTCHELIDYLNKNLNKSTNEYVSVNSLFIGDTTIYSTDPDIMKQKRAVKRSTKKLFDIIKDDSVKQVTINYDIEDENFGYDEDGNFNDVIDFPPLVLTRC